MKKINTKALAVELSRLDDYHFQDVIEKVLESRKGSAEIIRNALNAEYNNRDYEARRSLKIGDKVWFQSSRRKYSYRKIYGVITEIRRKRIVLDEYQENFKTKVTTWQGQVQRWRVIASMLNKVA